MIEFPNLQNVQNVTPAQKPRRQFYTQKTDSGGISVSQSGAADVVQISADAAMKGKLSAFALALNKEMDAVNATRIENLKALYAGDNCPISGADLAAAIVARIRADSFTKADDGDGGSR